MKKHIIRIISLILTAFLAVGLLVSCSDSDDDSDSHSASAKEETRYDKLLDGEDLDIMVTAYSPFVNIQNGQVVDGINVELIETIASRLGVGINWIIKDGYAESIDAIQSGEGDLFIAPTWIGTERALKVAYTRAHTYTDVVAYVRADDEDYNSLADIGDATRIAFVDGEYLEVYINVNYPSADLRPRPADESNENSLTPLLNEEADVVFAERAFIEANFDASGVREIGLAFRAQNTFFHQHGEHDFANVINNALEEMLLIGAIDRLIDKYLPIDCDGCIGTKG